MKSVTLRADALLLLTAIIWGFAFVAQRVGMDHIGPFAFNAARFVLGSLSLLPLIWLLPTEEKQDVRQLAPGCLVAGFMLYAGSSLQQIGLVYTTAGNAGFITGLYIVLVPFFALLSYFHFQITCFSVNKSPSCSISLNLHFHRPC